jgi:hypothetical protein
VYASITGNRKKERESKWPKKKKIEWEADPFYFASLNMVKDHRTDTEPSNTRVLDGEMTCHEDT